MRLAIALAFTTFTATIAAQQEPPARERSRSWDPAAAAAYLDARMDLWFANGTKLKTGDTQTACVSCHAGLAYALSRPVLRRVMQVDAPSTQEARLIDDTTRRVETYSTHQVLYGFNERRQIESRGTEAVLNAVILTSADAARNLREPSAPTKKALARLWETQRADGRWDWLESYLSSNYQAQQVYNRTWALLASTRVKRVVTDAQRDALIDELLQAQRDDGGWSLEAMGPWKWSKTAPPVKAPGDLDTSLLTQSDGYATGLVVYALTQAGMARNHAAIHRGIRWLETNQRAIAVPGVPGRGWHAHSLNYDREHGGEKGEPWRRLFMTDTATAFAILALADGDSQ
jgi:hypothetical protein